MEPLISTIVPIYKVEKYLRACVDSILDQTYKNIEVILVDDGSPDDCGKICDEYSHKDPRIKVIHKENGGLSDARNCGLDAATGEYISFIDSDDRIDPDLFRQAMERAPFSVLVFGCTDIYAQTGRSVPNRLNTSKRSVTWSADPQIIKEMVERSLFGYAWNKIYHRSIIGSSRFKDIALREDLLFNLEVLARVERISILNVPGYHYYHREDSLLTGTYSGPVPDITEVARSFLKIHPQLDPAVETEISNSIIKTYLLDALHKFVFRNGTLTDAQRKALLRSMIQDRLLRAHLQFCPGDGNLFRLLTLSYKLRWSAPLYGYLIRMWKP